MNAQPRFWVAVASRDHVLSAADGGFCQACHGKAVPLRRMHPGDGIAYYSSKKTFRQPERCQAFTAIGQVAAGDVSVCQISETFAPARRAVDFWPAQEASILPLIEPLSFIRNKRHWGYPFRTGFFEITADDFMVIAEAMGVTLPTMQRQTQGATN